MSKLFEYNSIAEGKAFVGREEEVKKLSSNFIFLTNTAVLAPQGYGKSSLIHKAAAEARHKEKNLIFCHVDLFNVRNEERFYELMVRSVLSAVSRSRKDVLDNVDRYFPDTNPRISFKSEGVDSLVVDFDWEEIRRNQDELLDLPYTVAKDRGCKMVVCIDDFHNISLFSDPDALLDRFRGRWIRHEGVSYCISASSNSLVDRFIKSAPMFYRYGETLELAEIRTSDIVKSIRDRYADTAKYIDNEIASLIVKLADTHPLYIQQLAHQSWLASSVVCSREVVLQAHETIVDQMGLVFGNLTASMTGQQMCYLHAILAGETVISTSEVLHRHHITSATSASRSKASLLERGVICIVKGKVKIADPIYAYWLSHRYFD